jgi:beta-phosphoglucomutase family hydrolase
VIGLPDSVRACPFDLDGVLTRTATVHSAAWKEMFDGYLRERAARTGEEFVPFDPVADYARYVEGKPGYDGVRSFLTARGIELPEGESGDPPGAETVRGLGNRKNELVLRMIREGGVEVYDGSVRYLEAAREASLRRAVVSSSANARDVLVAAGIEGFFEARIDGVVAEREGLKWKPAPDTFLAGARALGEGPGEAAVFEDALAGVAAGRAGDFACVVGVGRIGQAQALREHGASIVVSDLSSCWRTDESTPLLPA